MLHRQQCLRLHIGRCQFSSSSFLSSKHSPLLIPCFVCSEIWGTGPPSASPPCQTCLPAIRKRIPDKFDSPGGAIVVLPTTVPDRGSRIGRFSEICANAFARRMMIGSALCPAIGFRDQNRPRRLDLRHLCIQIFYQLRNTLTFRNITAVISVMKSRCSFLFLFQIRSLIRYTSL